MCKTYGTSPRRGLASGAERWTGRLRVAEAVSALTRGGTRRPGGSLAPALAEEVES